MQTENNINTGTPESEFPYAAVPAAPQVPFISAEALVYEKTEYEKSHVNKIFALLSLPLGYLLFKITGGLGLGMTLWILLLLIFTAAWFKVKKIAVRRAAIGYFLLTLLLSAFFIISDNSTLKSLSLLLFIPVYCYGVYTASGRRRADRLDSRFHRELASSVFVFPFSGCGASPIILGSGVKNLKSFKKLWHFLIGAAVMLPVFIIVLYMLEFDGAFSNLLDSFPAFSLSGGEIYNLIFGICFSFLIFGFLYQLIHRKDQIIAEPRSSRNVIPGSLVLGAVIPLLIIYILFFFSQLTYFISAFSSMLPDGMTYAQYARRGFSELCTVSGINAAVAAAALLFTKIEDSKSVVFRTAMSALSFFSMILIVISLQKMILYIEIYNLTPHRVYSSCFMLFLMLCFAAALIKLWVKRLNFMKISVIGLASMFMILCYSDSDRLIASYNAQQFISEADNSLDEDTLRKLGASATTVLIDLQDKEYSIDVDEELARRANEHSGDIWAFNLARYKSDKALEEYWENTDNCARYNLLKGLEISAEKHPRTA